VNSVAFSADGRLLLTASRDHDGRLWDVETGTVKQVLRAHYGEVANASFSPDGRWILTAGPAAAYLWQQGVRAPVLAPGFGGHQSRLTSAMFDPSSRFVLTASADGTVRRAECLVCRDLDGMLDLARLQLAETGRTLTQAERERYGLD
jgi:WD40 repeat protein